MTQANDSITVTPGTGATVATQLAGGKEYQVVIRADQNGDMDPVQPVTDNGGSLTVDDGGSSLTVDGTVTANAGTGTFTTKGYLPSTSDILSNSISVTNSTTPTTIITIPAGRTWYGSISLETLNTQNAQATPQFNTITVVGTNATPANGTVILQVVHHRAGNVSVNFDAIAPWTYITAPVGNSVALELTLSESNASHAAVANCNGVLL